MTKISTSGWLEKTGMLQSPFQFFDGRMGRGTKPPPQFGQTFPKTLSTQVAQNVHS